MNQHSSLRFVRLVFGNASQKRARGEIVSPSCSPCSKKPDNQPNSNAIEQKQRAVFAYKSFFKEVVDLFASFFNMILKRKAKKRNKFQWYKQWIYFFDCIYWFCFEEYLHNNNIMNFSHSTLQNAKKWRNKMVFLFSFKSWAEGMHYS